MLSICIPTYNRADFLPDTLESIISQADSTVEIVVSDNASTDNTYDIIQSFRSQFPNITYQRLPENIGADRNYLRSVDLARGRYCWLFGSDDVMRAGAVNRVLNELRSGAGIYLVGLTICTRTLLPINDHPLLLSSKQHKFNLSEPEDRHYYFKNAANSTALFSFLGSIIVDREKWNASIGEEKYIGTFWVHVAKCFGMISGGLLLKVIPDALLLKRGDNDSFMQQGIVPRIAIAVEGYISLGQDYFGTDSVELGHIKRVLRAEWPITSFSLVRDNLPAGDTYNQKWLDRLFLSCYCGNSWYERLGRLLYFHTAGRIGVRAINKLRALFSQQQFAFRHR